MIVQLGPRKGAAPKVVYRWDPDTDILSARLRPCRTAAGPAESGTVEIEGADGSWIVLDLVDRQIDGVEVVVWPQVRKNAALAVPVEVRDAVALLPPGGGAGAVASVEVEAPMTAESDLQERNLHFRIGMHSECAAVRVARDLLLEVDAGGHVAGFWLLNVPPFPQEP